MIRIRFDNKTAFFSGKVTVATGETSDYAILPYNAESSVAVYPSGRAKCQYTLSKVADVEAGTATWIDWPLGVVSANDADTIIGVASAVRLVSLQGEATMEVIAK